MGPISWLIFGGLASWVASMIAGTNERQGCFLNIVVGVIGAMIGGALYSLLSGRNFDFTWNIASFVVAVIGAVILLGIVGFVRRGNLRR